LDPAELESLLSKIRRWQPFDSGIVLEDVATLLDAYTPTKKQVDELMVRLPNHLKHLVDIATATGADRVDEPTARLITQARAMRSQNTPSEHQQAVGYLRRMAWVVNELLERLVELRCLREVA
jgi:hypothetical protein